MSEPATTAGGKKESIAQGMTRLDPTWDAPDRDPVGPTPPQTRVASSSKSAKAPKLNGTGAAQSGDAELRSLAERLGVTINDEPVRSPERVRIRDHLRSQKKGFDAHAARAQQMLRAEIQEHRPRIEQAAAIRRAFERGGPDDLARALSFNNWEEFIIAAAKGQAPEQRRLRALEARLHQKEREEAAAAERRKQAAREAERAQAQKRYAVELQASMANSTDRVVRAMSRDPQFVRTIMKIQEENWDGQKTVPAEKAIRMAVRGGSEPVLVALRKLHQKLSKARGGTAPSPAARPAPVPQRAGASAKTKTSARASIAEAKTKSRAEFAAELRRRLADQGDE